MSKKTTTRKPKEAKKKATRNRGVNKRTEFEEYAFFLSLGDDGRKENFGYKTDQQFADAHDLNPCTLTEWKSREDLWEKRDEHLTHFKKYTARIIESVAVRTVKSGNSFDAINFMKIVEGYTDRTGLDLTSKGKKVEGFKFVVVRPPQKKNHGDSQPTA